MALIKGEIWFKNDNQSRNNLVITLCLILRKYSSLNLPSIISKKKRKKKKDFFLLII